jgi:putative membrane protein
MTKFNRTGLAAGIAAALLVTGAARAQGTGAGGGGGAGPGTPSTGGSATPGTPSGTDTANPGRTDTATPGHSDTAGTGSTDTAPRGSAGTMHSGDTSTATAGGHAAAKVDQGLAQGLQKLHAANQAEIQMGQMGTQSAQDPQVKQFAQQMVDDHQKNDQQLEQLAQQAGVTLTGATFDKASKQAEKDMGKLHGQSGADFDRRFMSHMVTDHQKDVKEVASLAKRAHKAKQAELASFLDQTHSTIQGHLEQARTIAKASKGEQRQGRRGGASRSEGMNPQPGTTGSSGATDTSGSSGATAPQGTGSPGAEEKPHKP